VNRILKVTLFATMVVGIGAASGYLAPFAEEKKTEATKTILVSTLDSSSIWKAKIGGGCTGGEGLCCLKRLEGHLKEVKNIEKFETDKTSGFVTLTIKKGEEVKVKELQKALGDHWPIKSIERKEKKG